MKKTRVSALMAGCMLFGMSSAFAAPVIFVDAVSGDNLNDGESVGQAVATIAQGITLVDAGGTVNVLAGDYQEQVVIAKGLTLSGPNAGTDPNTTLRSAEATILASSHSILWDFADALIEVTTDDPVVIDGLFLQGFNPAVVNSSEPTGPNATDPVGANTGVYITGDETTVTNTIIEDISQWAIYTSGATDSTITNNSIENVGVPFVTGFGRAVIFGGQSYGTVQNNVFESCRVGIQVQGQNTAAPGIPALIDNNQMLNMEVSGVFLNVISNQANDFTVTNNTIVGQGPAFGQGGMEIITQNDGTGKRNHTIANNDISNIIAGYMFQSNRSEIRISGGTVSNVNYAAATSNRLGYRSIIDYQSSGAQTDAATGRDGTGGYALFSSAGSVAAIPKSGLTAAIQLPDALDDATGQSAFTNTDFTGNIALIDRGGGGWDAGLAGQNALNAGAVAVIIAWNNNNTPFELQNESSALSDVNIPITAIDTGDAAVVKNDINTNGNTVTASLYPWDVPSRSYGTNQPGVFTGPSSGELVNVAADNVHVAGFALLDIPNGIGSGNTPGTVTGSLLGGSKIQDAQAGALIVGENTSLSVVSARFENNEIGAEIIDGDFEAFVSTFANNTVAGIQVSGSNATADIDSSNFFGASQPFAVDLSDNPTGFQVVNSNFSADQFAINNNDPGSGDVIATGNYWGDPSGPNDAAGVINGTGAEISLGVDTGIIVTEEIFPDTASSLTADTSGDDIPDFLLIAIGEDPNVTYVPGDPTDSNGNGIPDEVELAAGLDLIDKDQDGDGIRDDYEVFRGTSPNNDLDFPPFGDANADGMVDNVDAVAMIEAFLGLRGFESINQFESDLNLDGQIDNVDAIILFNLVVANVPYIPFP